MKLLLPPRTHEAETRNSPERLQTRFPLGWLLPAFCLIAAAAYAWVDRYSMNPDGMSYLDMAQRSLQDGFGAFVNGYWSPLYPALLSLGLRVFHPVGEQIYPVVHAVNLAIFGLALLAFRRCARSFSTIPGPFAYGLFFWCTVAFSQPSAERPDLLVAALVLLAAAQCGRIQSDPRARSFAALGVILGLAYWAKAVMLPAGALLLALLWLIPPAGKRTRIRWLAAPAGFLALALPLVLATSRQVGHLSTGESGPIAYALYANGFPGFSHWRPQDGTPRHLPHQSITDPVSLLEFAAPVPGTNPLGYDPSYWFAGVTPHFDWRGQGNAIAVNLRSYGGWALAMIPLCAGALVLWRLAIPRTPAPHLLWLVLWPLAVGGLYLLVHVESRFLTGFVAIFWLALYTVLSQKVDTAARTGVLGTVLLALLLPALHDLAKSLTHPDAEGAQTVRVSRALAAAGIVPGDTLAVVGGKPYLSGGRLYRESAAFEAYYAQMLKTRVVAAILDSDDGLDVPLRPEPAFWHLDATARLPIEQRLRELGVRALIGLDRPHDATGEDWHPIPGTLYSFRLFPDPSLPRDQWISGATVGRDWANVYARRGLALGGQPEFGARYADSVALLAGEWHPDQTITATVHCPTGPAREIRELELRLRSRLTAHRATGYEITLQCGTTAPYAGIARWEGALGDFRPLTFRNLPGLTVRDGDQLRATASGPMIRGYLNDRLLVEARDEKFSAGAPGIGFYLEHGPASDQSQFGMTTIRATDGQRTVSQAF